MDLIKLSLELGLATNNLNHLAKITIMFLDLVKQGVKGGSISDPAPFYEMVGRAWSSIPQEFTESAVQYS
jgi:hypothetical protein